MTRLYTNENFPQPTVEALRSYGHDVLTAQDAGRAGQRIPDEAVLAYAHETQRVLVTFNRRHFLRLHRDGHPHVGIVACTVDKDFVGLAQRIHSALDSKGTLGREVLRVVKPSP